jgi:HEAT repeat protein
MLVAEDSDMKVRREAVGAIGRFSDLRATDILFTALGDPDATVRKIAALALGSPRHLKTVDAVQKIGANAESAVT